MMPTLSLSLSLSLCNLHTNDLQTGFLTCPCNLTWDGSHKFACKSKQEDILDTNIFYNLLPTLFIVCEG